MQMAYTLCRTLCYGSSAVASRRHRGTLTYNGNLVTQVYVSIESQSQDYSLNFGNTGGLR
jgi:hypothetical protein